MKSKNNSSKTIENIGLFVIILIITCAYAIVKGSYIWVIPTVFFVMYILFILRKRKNVGSEISDYFKNNSPEPLLEWSSKTFSLSKVDDRDVWLAYNKALALCYYGEFESAKGFMEAIDWSSRVSYIQSLDFIIKALTNYLKTGNYNYGLNFSKDMKKLIDESKVKLSNKRMKDCKDFYNIYIEIGELLTGNIEEDIIQSFEQRFICAQFFPKLLIAWCLGKIYLNLGDKDKSDTYIDYCVNNAPHCKPFQVFE